MAIVCLMSACTLLLFDLVDVTGAESCVLIVNAGGDGGEEQRQAFEGS